MAPLLVLPSILLKEQQSEANTPLYKVKTFNFMQLLFLTRTQFDRSTAQNDHERVEREGGKIVGAFHEWLKRCWIVLVVEGAMVSIADSG